MDGMKPHRSLLLLLVLAALWHSLPANSPPMLTVFTGRNEECAIDLLRRRGAHFEVEPRGFRLACDEASYQAIFDLMCYHQMAADLCWQNLAHAHTCKSPDGLPYRRQFLIMREGQPVVQTSQEDFMWVYDPTHPDACQEGAHKGYVAMPNIHVESERNCLQRQQELAASYAAILRRIESQRSDLVIFRIQPPPEVRTR